MAHSRDEGMPTRAQKPLINLRNPGAGARKHGRLECFPRHSCRYVYSIITIKRQFSTCQISRRASDGTDPAA